MLLRITEAVDVLMRVGSVRPQGKYIKADSLYVRAISIGERRLGSAHPDLAIWLGNRAALLQAQVRVYESLWCVALAQPLEFPVFDFVSTEASSKSRYSITSRHVLAEASMFIQTRVSSTLNVVR